MATKKFPSEFSNRGTVKLTDKILIQNIDSGEDCYTTVNDLFAIIYTALGLKASVSTGTTASTPSTTPVALFTADNPGIYIVSCYIPGGDNPTHATAMIIFDGGGGPQYSIRNYDHGAQMTITVSGSIVYATHSFGSSQTIAYTKLTLK